MIPDTPNYRAFLLRCWSETGTQSGQWRFSLENTQSQQRLHFADLRQLVQFLSNLNAPIPATTDNS